MALSNKGEEIVRQRCPTKEGRLFDGAILQEGILERETPIYFNEEK